jgi:hypothetical protein
MPLSYTRAIIGPSLRIYRERNTEQRAATGARKPPFRMRVSGVFATPATPHGSPVTRRDIGYSSGTRAAESISVSLPLSAAAVRGVIVSLVRTSAKPKPSANFVFSTFSEVELALTVIQGVRV